MKSRRSIYGCGIVLVALVGLAWIGGKWLAEHGIAYVLYDHSEFGDRKSVVDAVEVTVGISAVLEWRILAPLVVRATDADDHSLYVELSIPEEVDATARISSAELIVEGDVRPLSLHAAEDPDGPPATSWHPFHGYRDLPGRRIDYFVHEEVVIPPSVRTLRVRVGFEVRLGDETRRGQAALELSRREWSSSGFRTTWVR
jgi:hypothetical protein